MTVELVGMDTVGYKLCLSSLIYNGMENSGSSIGLVAKDFKLQQNYSHTFSSKLMHFFD